MEDEGGVGLLSVFGLKNKVWTDMSKKISSAEDYHANPSAHASYDVLWRPVSGLPTELGYQYKFQGDAVATLGAGWVVTAPFVLPK